MKFLAGFLIGSVVSCAPVFGGGELFRSAEERAGFVSALSSKDKAYDPKEKMLAGRFSSPGYHTTLKGGTVHRTRDSLVYAVALFDSGEAARIARGKEIVRRVIGLQDQDSSSRTYGIWSWFLEEPLENMAPPDWNWADFCGTQLLQIAIDHDEKLDEELRGLMRESILHACASIKRRDVKPGYTNIAIMGTYVTLAAGELYGKDEIFDYGMMRLNRFYDYTMEKGSFSEYNSPTYSMVAIKEISRMVRHVKSAEARRIIEKLNRFAWYHVARHFHSPTKQWAGPHSRSYRTILGGGAYEFIQQATAGKVRFFPSGAVIRSLDGHRIRPICPEEYYDYFAGFKSSREEIEAFVLNKGGGYDLIGTTWLDSEFTLGSVNVGDLWNQRRPLVGYWRTGPNVGAVRLRCLHDGYDYSSASVFCVQSKGDVVAAIVFATDRGDTHISIDRIKDGSIKAKDLRVRVQFEGELGDLELAEEFRISEGAEFAAGEIEGEVNFAYYDFDDAPLVTDIGREGSGAWLDLVLYKGDEKTIRFDSMDSAVVVVGLSMRERGKKGREGAIEVAVDDEGVLTAKWGGAGADEMELVVPVKPMRSSEQRNAAGGKLGGVNAWKVRRD